MPRERLLGSYIVRVCLRHGLRRIRLHDVGSGEGHDFGSYRELSAFLAEHEEPEALGAVREIADEQAWQRSLAAGVRACRDRGEADDGGLRRDPVLNPRLPVRRRRCDVALVDAEGAGVPCNQAVCVPPERGPYDGDARGLRSQGALSTKRGAMSVPSVRRHVDLQTLPSSDRKSARGSLPSGAVPAVQREGDTWTLRSYAAVKAVLRAGDAVTQAGFNAELATRTGLRPPVLFEDGAAHREHRVAIARFFTPSTIDAEYRELMDSLSDALVADLLRRGRADLGDLSLELAMQVAARVVGLTDSWRPGLAQRLEAILALPRLEGVPAWRRAASLLATNAHVLRFYLFDVRPAIRARRRQPRSDVIGHLLERGYKDAEVLIECITYGAAGMATTREFVVMAAWHLLEDDALRGRYLAGDLAERTRVLHEILRLEPVVGHLYRRAAQALTIEHDGTSTTIPAGARIDLDLRAANADPAAVGDDPLRLRPGRSLAPRVGEAVLSFGDGAHRCPGSFLAIAESDAFLTRLLRLPLRLVGTPRLGWNDLIEGYEVRGLEVAVG